MKLKIKIIFSFILFVYSFSYGQIEQYKYKRELFETTDQWHKITLPKDVFGKSESDLQDIRIFGISPNKDTVEAPYILQLANNEISKEQVSFSLINQSRNSKGAYFTFEVKSQNTINNIKLNFKNQNFDWKVELEGSQNLNEWYTILDNYRILSINNSNTNYRFTNLVFLNSSYRYYRLLVAGEAKPTLVSAEISHIIPSLANYINYPINHFSISEDKKAKQTQIDVNLGMPVPISYMQLFIGNDFDYYRPITIKYLVDSFETEQGWKYTYQTLASGTLSSLEKNGIEFRSTVLQKLKISVHNHDNAPLDIDSLNLRGYTYELITRINEEGKYFLVYGRKNAATPNYDISQFSSKIPKELVELKLKEEQLIVINEKPITQALFKNPIWLWLIMGTIIFILGWFSIRMMKKV